DTATVQSGTERTVVETASPTGIAFGPDVVQEGQVRDDDPLTPAQGTRTTGVGAEPRGMYTVHSCEEHPYRFGHAEHGGRCRTDAAVQRCLADNHEIGVLARQFLRDQRALPRPRDTADDRENTKRHVDGDVSKIVASSVG